MTLRLGSRTLSLGAPSGAPTGPLSGAPSGTLSGHALVFATFCLYSCAWSWPLVSLPLGSLPPRWFDVYPMLWLLGRAPAIGLDLAHPASAWPLGEVLYRADSYVLLAMGWAGGGWTSPLLVARLLALLGPAINAFAAERCAAGGFGVPRPWSWLAGLAYGFSGIAGVALLEGHLYHLLNPWLPLLWWAWRRGVLPPGNAASGSAAWGLVVGASLALALYTTAYFGVFASVLLVVLTMSGGWRGLRLWPGLTLVAGPAIWWYVRLFLLGGALPDSTGGPDLFFREGTTTLAGLAGLTGAADAYGHSLATPLGWVPLWLLLLSPVILARKPAWRVPAALALLALLGTLGRDIALAPGVELLHLPLDPIARLPGVAFFRFPIRLYWIYALCGGVVASLALAALAEHVPRRAALGLLFLAGLDSLVGVNLPGREASQLAEVPSAYASAPPDRAVLDLFGAPADGSVGELEPWVRGLGCWYQANHHRPILELCIGTGVQSPREVVQRWLVHALWSSPDRPSLDAAAPTTEPAETLGQLGIGAVALHLNSFHRSDAVGLSVRLRETLGLHAALSTDGGEQVELFLVPLPTGGAHPLDRYRHLR